MSNVIVVGGGAAGMMAAIISAQKGNKVILLEQNEKLGKKLFITGKGRCNVTNACDRQELLSHVISNQKFLYHAFYAFDAAACMDFFEQLGVRLKVERGNRVFPASDHSSDIIRALSYEMRRLNVDVRLDTKVAGLLTRELTEAEPAEKVKDKMQKMEAPKGEAQAEEALAALSGKNKKQTKNATRICEGVMLRDGTPLQADAVILATGGISYPLTGASGAGIKMAEKAGMQVTTLYPALVPLRTRETWGHELMGLSLRNVGVTVRQGKKTLYEGFGEMLFTHNGVSGPLILSASSLLTKKLKSSEMDLLIDLKPALDDVQLDKRLLRDFERTQNKAVKNAMAELLPARLIVPVLTQAGVSPDKKVNTIAKAERQAILFTLKHLQLTITGTADFNEAIITQGGISVRGVNPSTMESKCVSNLYLAGECLDLDALTGGFNLQIAWATGYLAGSHAGENN